MLAIAPLIQCVPHRHPTNSLTALVASAVTLEKAYASLCAQRTDAGHNNGIWDVRWNWQEILPNLQEQLLTGTYRLSPLQSYCIEGKWLSAWAPRGCHHTQGIPKGCPLSPLMAALYFKPLDDEMKKRGFYVRYMGDWLVMVKTKHQLRHVIKLTHQILSKLKLKMHPDKTYLGAMKKGFNFLGVHFGAQPEISKTSLEKHHVKIAQRYAQGASEASIGKYVARWTSWCRSMLHSCESNYPVNQPFHGIIESLADTLRGKQLKEQRSEISKPFGRDRCLGDLVW